MSCYLPADHKEYNSYTKLYNFLLTPIQLFNRLLCVARLKSLQDFQNSPVKVLSLVLLGNPVKQMRLVLSKMRWKQENEFMSKIILSLKMIYNDKTFI